MHSGSERTSSTSFQTSSKLNPLACCNASIPLIKADSIYKPFHQNFAKGRAVLKMRFPSTAFAPFRFFLPLCKLRWRRKAVEVQAEKRVGLSTAPITAPIGQGCLEN